MSASVTVDTPASGGDTGRPAWLPEKFKTPEDLVKSYTELESKLGTGEAKKLDEKKPDDPAPAAPKESPLAKAAQEVAANGFLTEATAKALTEKGIPLSDVQAYIAGKKSEAEVLQTELTKVTGDAESLTETLKWAKENLDRDTVAAYDEAVASGRVKVAAALLQGIVAARGKEPKLVEGSTNGLGGIQGFASQAQMIQAMNDPKYAADPAYRELVAKRLAASSF